LNNKEHKNTNRISRKPPKSPKKHPEISRNPPKYSNKSPEIPPETQTVDLVLRRADPRLWADYEIWTWRIIKNAMDFMGFDGIRMGIHWMLMGLKMVCKCDFTIKNMQFFLRI